MICYRDMTFCEEKKCSEFKNCHRALTNKVQKEAEKWWGSKDAPICVFLGKPDCFKE